MRLAKREGRPRWDALVDGHHCLGFRRFAGRGLRRAFEWRGHWVGLGGWQSGAFKCGPRDRWIGWSGRERFRRPHLIANNRRFLVLGAPGAFPNPASRALSAMTRRLGADWEAAHGHALLLAEAFVDPSRFGGGMQAAANWAGLGRTKGFARSNGRHTDPHGVRKALRARPLRRGAQRLLAAPGPLPEALSPNPMGGASGRRPPERRSLLEGLARVPDLRRARGRKHPIASVRAVCVLARRAGMGNGLAAARPARSLSQAELAALGAWRNPGTGRFEPASKSVIHRVLAQAGPEAVEAALGAAAAAGRGAGVRRQAHPGREPQRDGAPRDRDLGGARQRPAAGEPRLPRRGGRGRGGAGAAGGGAAGRPVTVDAPRTVRDTARAIVGSHGADCLMTVKGNAPETFAALAAIDWERDAAGRHEEEAAKARGRAERRRIRTLTPLPGAVNHPHLKQVLRVERRRIDARSGQESRELAYGITSAPAERGAPEPLPAWNRGHWAVENRNRRTREVRCAEDARPARAGRAPVNNALRNRIALAVILGRGKGVAEAARHFAPHRDQAIDAVPSPA